MGEYAESELHRLGFWSAIKKPLVLIIIAGLVIRGILIPFLNHNYDIPFWATTIQHIQSGNGLYGLSGYYYTPVWGYILGFLGLIATYVFRISSFGTISNDLIPSSGAGEGFYGTMVVSPEFSIFIKSFLTIFDLLCAYLIYVIVKRFRHSDKEATIAFGLWFLCPLVIYSSAVQIAFDNISVTFMLLSLVLIIDRRYTLAGASLTIAALTKFFPAYLIFILLVYILKKNPERISRVKSVLSAIIGAATACVVILLPQMLLGSLPQAFGLISNRVSWAGEIISSSSWWDSMVSLGIVIVVMLQFLIFALLIIVAYKTYKTREDKFDKTFMFMLMISSMLVFLWTPGPSYLLITIPFLAYTVATAKSEQEKRYVLPLIMIVITATAYAITMHNYAILFQSSVYFDLVSADTILNGIAWLNHAIIPGFTRQTLLNVVMGAAETFAIYSVFIVYLYNWRETKAQKEVAI